MGPLELYSLGNMVLLVRFSLSLPSSMFFNLPPFTLPSWALQGAQPSLKVFSPLAGTQLVMDLHSVYG